MKQFRVLLVSPVGELGGAEQVFLSLLEHLPAYGITPILACLRPGPLVERAQSLGVEAHAFIEHRYREPLKVWQGAQWLAALARRAKADLMHSNHMGHLYAGLAGRWARIPEVWHLHDYPYRPDVVDRLVQRLPTDHIIFTTSRVRDGFLHLQSRPHDLIYPICVEPERLRVMPQQADIRARYALPPGPMLLTVTRLQAHKGHRFLLDAAVEILRAHPEAMFAITGKASGPEQEQYRVELLAQVERLGLGERVKFLGYVPDEDLVSLYREATALVHPAMSEGFGLTLLEAMALGVPVIAAAADGPRAILTDGKTGLLVPTGDSAALAGAVKRLLDDKALVQTLRQEGIDHAATFRVETTIRQTVAVYCQILNRPVPD